MVVNLIESKFPSVQHVFGGEVRYRTNYIKWDDVTPANIVLLGKIVPAYNGQTFSAVYTHTFSTGEEVQAELWFYPTYSQINQWQINGGASNTTFPTPTSITTRLGGVQTQFPVFGSTATAPLAPGGYETRITSVSGA